MCVWVCAWREIVSVCVCVYTRVKSTRAVAAAVPSLFLKATLRNWALEMKTGHGANEDMSRKRASERREEKSASERRAIVREKQRVRLGDGRGGDGC